MHAYSHPGIDKTFERRCELHELTEQEVDNVVRNVILWCDTCATCKPRIGRHVDTGNNYPIPRYPFTSVAMDVVHLPIREVKKGHRVDACLVVVCCAKGCVVAVHNRMQGLNKGKVADIFLEKCVFFTCLPSDILGGNGKCSKYKFVHTLCQLVGVDQHTCFIYSHKTNVRLERVVKAVFESLRLCLSDTNTDINWW